MSARLVLSFILLSTSCAGPRTAAPPPVATASAAAPAASPTRIGGSAAFLAHVPASARAVAVVGPSMLSWLHDWLRARPAMRRELTAYLVRMTGLDLTRVRGLVAWTARISEPPEAAVLVELDGPGTLAAPPSGQHRGVDLIPVDGGKLLAARVPGGLLIGSPAAVREGIDRAKQAVPALSRNAPCFATAAPERAGLLVAVDAAALQDPKAQQLVQQFELRAAMLSVEGDRIIARVNGAPAKLQLIKQIASQVFASALAGTEKEKAEALSANKPEQALAKIIAHHELRHTLAELEPRLHGDLLESAFRLPRLDGATGFVAIAGTLSAVAIPAFVKYIRRSKAMEAHEALAALRRGVEAHHAAAQGKRRAFRFPSSTDWTPAATCRCPAAGQTCTVDPKAFETPTWRALGFAPTGAGQYQYRFTSKGKGGSASFVIEARGDLDCNGKFSSFRVEGGIGDKGALQIKEPEIKDELD